MPRIAFLALGEPHQLFHILGPAAALSRSGHSVTLLVSTVWHERIVDQLAPNAGIVVERLRSLTPHRTAPPIQWTPSRLGALALNWNRFSKFDMLVMPERSSTLLKTVGAYSGMLAHIPHGAGDREVSYDSRIKRFDCVITAGEKDRRRMIERGLTSEQTCVAAGYAKFDLISKEPINFFGDSKPVVLYNPHFDPDLSSWPTMGANLVAAFEKNERFNFIIAPHIRARGAIRKSLQTFAAHNRSKHIRFDLGSLHSINMDYTRMASIYLGDVSSQVYEFIHNPRPCVFLNPRNLDWKNDDHFWHWRYGPVVSTAGHAMSCMTAALDLPDQFAAVQRESMVSAIAQPKLTASEDIAAALMQQFRLWRATH